MQIGGGGKEKLLIVHKWDLSNKERHSSLVIKDVGAVHVLHWWKVGERWLTFCQHTHARWHKQTAALGHVNSILQSIWKGCTVSSKNKLFCISLITQVRLCYSRSSGDCRLRVLSYDFSNEKESSPWWKHCVSSICMQHSSYVSQPHQSVLGKLHCKLLLRDNLAILI